LKFELKAELLLQLSHTNAILSSQELVNISSVEMEYAKSFYEDGQLTNTSIVNNTIAPLLANLTYDELIFTEAVLKGCGNLTGIGNVTGMLVPVRQDGVRSDAGTSISLGPPIDAFFCDASNNHAPDPVISQGDTIRVCARLSQNSSYFHLEDLYMIAITQPTTGVMTHYAVNKRNTSALATKNCELGLCNILTSVPSRFFDQDSGPLRIVGVALLNLGPNDRRVLLPIQYTGNLQLDTADAPRSAFQLMAEIIGNLEAPTNNSNTNSDLSNAWILLLASILVLTLVVCFILLRRRLVSKGPPLGDALGELLGKPLGDDDGSTLGEPVGVELGATLGEELEPELGEEHFIWEEPGPALGAALGEALGEELGPELGDDADNGEPVGVELGATLGEELGPELGEEHFIWKEPGPALGAALGEALGEELGPELGDGADNGSEDASGEELGELLRKPLGDDDGATLGEPVGAELGAALGEELGPEAGRGTRGGARTSTGRGTRRSAGRGAMARAGNRRR
jgi:hypothetical protein